MKDIGVPTQLTQLYRNNTLVINVGQIQGNSYALLISPTIYSFVIKPK